MPGSSKTAVNITAAEGAPASIVCSDLTAQTFASGLGKKQGGTGGLLQLLNPMAGGSGTQGILLFKDFSSFIARRPEVRGELMSQLREIYDGSYDPKKGVKVPAWSGKVTIIAAATPAIERAWAVQRELGERFVQVRWSRQDGVAMARAAGRQVGHHKQIGQELRRLSKDLIEGAMKIKAERPEPEEFAWLAEMTARLRAHVVRDNDAKRTIIDVPEPEAPTRLTMVMAQIARGHAALFGRKQPAKADVDAAKRIAYDTVPSNRYRVFRNIPDKGGVNRGELIRASGLPESSIIWITDELKALGVLAEISEIEVRYAFTEEFQKLKNDAMNGTEWTPIVDDQGEQPGLLN